MLIRKIFSILVIVFYAITINLKAQENQDKNYDSDDITEEWYAHFPKCIELLFLKADSVRAENGELAEINLLKEKRNSCEFSSPITRRIALKYLEWGDSEYDDRTLTKEIDKKELFKKGLELSYLALSEDSLDDINYEQMSMAYAAAISVASLKGKARMADSVRIYAEKSIELNPRNDRSYHILGRWHYEVSKLSWFLRTLSKIIFNDSPEGSFQKSIDYFEHAIQIKDKVVHRFYLGSAYLEKGNKKEALKNFMYLQNLPLIQHNDAYFKEKAKKLIEKYE